MTNFRTGLQIQNLDGMQLRKRVMDIAFVKQFIIGRCTGHHHKYKDIQFRSVSRR